MDIETLRDYCLSLKGAEEKMPFDDKILVFTVKDKMFCLTDIENYEFINVKCKPEIAIDLRERYNEVIPGFHMNKKHWNSIKLKGSIRDELIKQWVLDSYHLVVAGLPQKVQKTLMAEDQLTPQFDKLTDFKVRWLS